MYVFICVIILILFVFVYVDWLYGCYARVFWGLGGGPKLRLPLGLKPWPFAAIHCHTIPISRLWFRV